MNQPGPNYAIAAMKPNFSLLKYILLGIITFGIYDLWMMAKMADTLNTLASPQDGKKTMNFWLLAFIIGPITFGIGYLVWFHKYTARLGEECTRRGINDGISAATFWLWDIVLAVICIGPFVYIHKIAQATNHMIMDAQQRGF